MVSDKSENFKSLKYEKSDIGPDIHEFICVNMQDEGTNYFAGSYGESGIKEQGFTVLSSDGINEYEVVRFYNGLFGYKLKNSESPFPYRFLIAGEFNVHGLAMVGINGGISLIDESFNILTKCGWKSFRPRTLLTIDNYDGLFPIEIEQIIGDESVIARVFFGETSYCLDFNHEIIGLSQERDSIMNGDEVPLQERDENEEILTRGYVIQERGVKFIDGRFYSWSDLGRIAIKQYPNFLSVIKNRGEKRYVMLPKK